MNPIDMKKQVGISIAILFTHIIVANAKCVIYDVCSNRTNFRSGFDNPAKVQWLPCHVDNIEPRRLDNKAHVDLFKKLCPMMYKQDDEALCCSINQLLIIEFDIVAAQAIMGPCPACYLNFRTIWCNLACNPDQAEFVYPEIVQSIKYHNFSQSHNEYKAHLKKLQDDEDQSSRMISEKDEEEEENEKTQTDVAVDHSEIENSKNLSDASLIEEKEKIQEEPGDLSDSNSIERRSVNDQSNEQSKRQVVTRFRYFLRDEFMIGLLESCRFVSFHIIIQQVVAYLMFR
jgi:hypothetical protein